MATDQARPLSTTLTSIMLLVTLLTAVMISLGFLITHVLVHFWPLAVEERVVDVLTAARTPGWDRASNLVSLAAYTIALAVAMAVTGCAMRIAYHRWREAFFLGAAMLAQIVVYLVTSRVVGRARPPVPELDVFPPMRSFPSGHVAAAVALYGGIAMILAMHARRRAHAVVWWALLLLIPVAVAISRVYRGMHYPSDVAASFIAGLGCLWIMRRAMFTSEERRGKYES